MAKSSRPHYYVIPYRGAKRHMYPSRVYTYTYRDTDIKWRDVTPPRKVRSSQWSYSLDATSISNTFKFCLSLLLPLILISLLFSVRTRQPGDIFDVERFVNDLTSIKIESPRYMDESLWSSISSKSDEILDNVDLLDGNTFQKLGKILFVAFSKIYSRLQIIGINLENAFTNGISVLGNLFKTYYRFISSSYWVHPNYPEGIDVLFS